MKTKNLLVGAVLTTAVAFSLPLHAGKNPSEVVDQKSLPPAVQKTIKEKAAGGEIVRVQREDDKTGKWNYEVIVKKNGKESGFEVDPNGKFVKQNDEHSKADKH